MRRQITITAALLVLATACSGSGAAPPTTTTSLVVTTTTKPPPSTLVVTEPLPSGTIEVWVPGDVTAQIRDAVEAFESETAVAVTVTAVESDTVLDQLVPNPSAGPDVFIGPHTWLSTLTRAGIAEPLTPRTEVVGGAVEAVTLREVVFAAPLGLNTIAQFRDTGALSIAPDSVESLTTGCPGGDGVGPCLILPVDSVDGHYPFLVAAGGYVFGPDPYEGWDASDVGVDSAEAEAGVLILASLVDAADIYGDGTSTGEQRFAAGVAPILWGDLESLAALRALGARFVVEPLPRIADSPAVAPVSVTAAWVNAFSPEKDAAVLFVTEYLADPATADAVAIDLGLAPVNVGFSADPDLVPFTQAARSAHPVPTIFQTSIAWEQLAEAFAAVRSGGDVAEALREAAAEIRRAPEGPATEEG